MIRIFLSLVGMYYPDLKEQQQMIEALKQKIKEQDKKIKELEENSKK
ncbi:MAG: hypothetical protein WC868_09395 [Bacteroidales bacterium]